MGTETPLYLKAPSWVGNALHSAVYQLRLHVWSMTHSLTLLGWRTATASYQAHQQPTQHESKSMLRVNPLGTRAGAYTTQGTGDPRDRHCTEPPYLPPGSDFCATGPALAGIPLHHPSSTNAGNQKPAFNSGVPLR